VGDDSVKVSGEVAWRAVGITRPRGLGEPGNGRTGSARVGSREVFVFRYP